MGTRSSVARRTQVWVHPRPRGASGVETGIAAGAAVTGEAVAGAAHALTGAGVSKGAGAANGAAASVDALVGLEVGSTEVVIGCGGLATG